MAVSRPGSTLPRRVRPTASWALDANGMEVPPRQSESGFAHRLSATGSVNLDSTAESRSISLMAARPSRFHQDDWRRRDPG
jgi:hypothetical protein